MLLLNPYNQSKLQIVAVFLHDMTTFAQKVVVMFLNSVLCGKLDVECLKKIWDNKNMYLLIFFVGSRSGATPWFSRLSDPATTDLHALTEGWRSINRTLHGPVHSLRNPVSSI